MTHHSWKPYDYQIQNRILDPGPEPLAGLRHGVPGEGLHHLPDLQVGLVVKLCSGPHSEKLHVVHRASGRSTVSKRKHKRFYIEAYYRNKTKTFWFGPLFIGTKAERFNLFQNGLELNRNVLEIFKV